MVNIMVEVSQARLTNLIKSHGKLHERRRIRFLRKRVTAKQEMSQSATKRSANEETCKASANVTFFVYAKNTE